MWNKERDQDRRSASFFRVAVCHDTLVSRYKTNFYMMHLYGYSLTEIENMVPWEREVYIGLLEQHIEDSKNQE